MDRPDSKSPLTHDPAEQQARPEAAGAGASPDGAAAGPQADRPAPSAESPPARRPETTSYGGSAPQFPFLNRSPVTYASYLRLDELLSLQQPRSDGPEHDETLFIIIHQVYELWFKEIAHELDYLQRLLERNDTARALHTLKRILTILKVLVSQIDVLETMTPLEFLSFRDRLESGSGHESFQFREIEFAIGHKRRGVFERYPEGTEVRRRLEERFGQPTLWDAFLRLLARNGYGIPRAHLDRDVTQPVEPSEEIQRVLIDVYRRNPMLSELCERLVDLDEGVQEWRYRHIKMVQRTIGAKMGTGGTSGAAYLATTLSTPVFPDLWAIRTEL